MKRKSRKPRSTGIPKSNSNKDVGSGSDNESIGDIFTDEINDFTQARNKVSLGPEVSDSEEEEAILPLHGDDDEDDSDEELGEWSKRLKQIKLQNKLSKNKIKGAKPEGSWGTRREDYYGSFAKKNLRRVAAEEEDDWTLEAKEVEKLQSKLDEDIEEEDYMTPSLSIPSKPSHKEKELTLTVKQDLTDKEKKEHQDKLHPEAQPLREELNKCLAELQLLQGQKGWRIQSKDTCFRLLASNIAFYLHLIETNEDCRGHPVLKRIVQWKKLAKMYQEIPEDQMEASEDENASDVEERNVPRMIPDEDEEMLDGEEQEKDSKDTEELSSRPITYQMAKNKVSKKKSKHNNPRVKHKEKFKKAIIRRRGQVREYRPEIVKYQGEASGIRAGITKSVRLH